MRLDRAFPDDKALRDLGVRLSRRDQALDMYLREKAEKHFIGLYILRTDVMNAHADQLKGVGISHGKGCIRYSKPEKIDFKVVKSLLKATGEVREGLKVGTLKRTAQSARPLFLFVKSEFEFRDCRAASSESAKCHGKADRCQEQ